MSCAPKLPNVQRNIINANSIRYYVFATTEIKLPVNEVKWIVKKIKTDPVEILLKDLELSVEGRKFMSIGQLN